MSLLLTALPVLVLAVLGWQRRWMSDDGFINVRVVDNVFAGHGPVFNVGERVEVGTSTLWLALLHLLHAATPFLEVSQAAVAGGLACTVLGAAAAGRGSLLLWRSGSQRPDGEREALVLPLGLVVLAGLPPVWDFATSGLETGLVLLWLGGSFLLLARRLPRRRGDGTRLPAWQPLWPAVVIGLGPLVRPDLALVSLALGLALAAQSRRSPGSWLGAAGVAAAVPLGYEVLRAGYYATLVPNTALAKSAGESAWAAGLRYLQDYAGLYALVLPLGVAAAAGLLPLAVRFLRARDGAAAALLLAPVLGGLLHGLYVVRVGGDFMHGRFLLPATFAVLLPVSVVVLPLTRRGLATAALPVAVVTGWALVVGTSVRVDYAGGVGPDGIADERGVYVLATGPEHPVQVADFASHGAYAAGQDAAGRAAAGQRYYFDPPVGPARPPAPGREVVVRTRNIGLLGTVAGERVLLADTLALSDAVGARLELPPADPPRAGHALVVPEVWHRARYAVPAPDDAQPVLDARAALACGRLAELQQALSSPMTPGRFWQNLRAAPSLTRLTVPGDPALARQELCG